MLVRAPVREAKLAEQTGVHEQAKRAVHREPAHLAASSLQVGDKLVDVEVLVRVERYGR